MDGTLQQMPFIYVILCLKYFQWLSFICVFAERVVIKGSSHKLGFEVLWWQFVILC